MPVPTLLASVPLAAPLNPPWPLHALHGHLHVLCVLLWPSLLLLLRPLLLRPLLLLLPPGLLLGLMCMQWVQGVLPLHVPGPNSALPASQTCAA